MIIQFEEEEEEQEQEQLIAGRWVRFNHVIPDLMSCCTLCANKNLFYFF